MDENNLTNYQSYLKFERNLTDNSVEAYLSDIKKLQDFVRPKGLSLCDVGQSDVEEFL